jgi:hypothetical protein
MIRLHPERSFYADYISVGLLILEIWDTSLALKHFWKIACIGNTGDRQ